MKHIKLFEQFILEASNEDRIKEIQAELKDINSQVEELQNAADNGKMDPDEAEIEISDLDGFKLELEEELEDLMQDVEVKASATAKKLKSLGYQYAGFYQGDFKDSDLLKYEADGTSDKKAKAKLLQIAAKIEKQETQQNKKSEQGKKAFDALMAKSGDKLTAAEKKYLSWLVSPSRLKSQSEASYYRKKAEIAAKVNKLYGTKEGEAQELAAKYKEAAAGDKARFEKDEALAAEAGLA